MDARWRASNNVGSSRTNVRYGTLAQLCRRTSAGGNCAANPKNMGHSVGHWARAVRSTAYALEPTGTPAERERRLNGVQDRTMATPIREGGKEPRAGSRELRWNVDTRRVGTARNWIWLTDGCALTLGPGPKLIESGHGLRSHVGQRPKEASRRTIGQDVSGLTISLARPA